MILFIIQINIKKKRIIYPTFFNMKIKHTFGKKKITLKFKIYNIKIFYASVDQ